ncbi:MAG: hypothetical protein QM756_37785 [Polyangiaceae bacterium]
MLAHDAPSIPLQRRAAGGGVRWWLGGLTFALMSAGFAAFWLRAPRIYEVETSIAAQTSLDGPDAAALLERALLEPSLLNELQRQPFAGAGAGELARHVQASLQVEAGMEGTFALSLRDSNAQRAAAACNWLAAESVRRAPELLRDRRDEAALELAQQRARVSLLSFVATHPALAKLASPEAARDTALLVQHLATIAAQQSEAELAKQVPVEVIRELKRLLAEQAKPTAEPPALPAHALARAEPPSWPIEPDPRRLGGLGLLSALAAATGVVLLSKRRAAPRARPTAESFAEHLPHPAPVRHSMYDSVPTNKSNNGLPTPTSEPPSSAPASRERDVAGPDTEGDRVTPISSFPARIANAVSERPLQALLEVNAGQAVVSDERSQPYESERVIKPTSARTTHVLGSPIPPILAPGSRRTPSAGSIESRPAPVSTTSYSYVSSAPPAGPTSSRSAAPRSPTPAPPNKPLSIPPQRPRFRSNPGDIRDSSVITTRRAPEGWRPDLSLLPESRRSLCDELYPLAVSRCCAVGVVGSREGKNAKSRLAAELSLALAESGHARVLLLDADLEQPAVKRLMRVEMPLTLGFSEQLRARIEVRVPRPWTVIECWPSLHVMAEGSTPLPELLLSRPFEDCLRELGYFYDFIVIDGPSIDNTSACQAVQDVIDWIAFSHGRFGPSELSRVNSLFGGKHVAVVAAEG